MPLNEVLERRAKREGKVTLRAVVENLLHAIERGEVETVVFVPRQTDGLIKTGWSNTLYT